MDDTTYTVFYSMNNTTWYELCTAKGSVKKLLKVLYNTHTAMFYRIMDVVYQLNGSTKTYDRI